MLSTPSESMARRVSVTSRCTLDVLDLLAQAVLVRDAAADALVAQAEIAVQAVGRRADAVLVEVQRLIADDRIVDVLHDLVPRHRLDVVGVDVDHEPVLQLAPAGGDLRACSRISRLSVEVSITWAGSICGTPTIG